MTAKGTKSRNFNPIGIFDWCTSRDQVVDYSINKAKEVFIKRGYRITTYDNPDTGGDGDFIIEKYPEVSIVSCKATTQTTRSKNPKPEINIRTNSKSITWTKRKFRKRFKMFIGRQLVRHIPWSGNISQSNKW